MKISVVVCTYNRCDDLRIAMQSLMLQDFLASDYEILIVDNNSTDRTKDVVLEFPHVRYLLEEKIGLSYARNRGIEESQGEIIAFIDDDARAEKTWLSVLNNVYKEEKDIGCVGGRVMLDWVAPKPTWLQPELDEVFNGINYSDAGTVLSYPQVPYGTNISYKAGVFHEIGFFGTELGRIGTKLLAGEETELCLRIEKKGYKIFYKPEAIVYHRVEPDKLTKSYIRKRAIWHGRSHAMIELKHFGHSYAREKAINNFKDVCRWVRTLRYSIVEQKKYYFKFGYFLQVIMPRS